MSFVGDVQNLTSAVKKLKEEINGIFAAVKKLSPEARGTIKDLTGLVKAGGQIGVGQGPKINLGTDSARFSSGTPQQGGFNNSMPWLAAYKSEGRTQIAGGIAKMPFALAAGAYAAMPDLGTTVSRAAGFYGAAVFGGVNRVGLETSTTAAMQGRFGRGVSSPLDQAAASAQLVQGYRYMPGSAAYRQSMSEVGGALRLLNMNNATAAAAIGGFQTGQMGANLYQYGIAQFDAQGNPVPQAQIARQLYNRIFPNQKGLTSKDVQMSLQYGLAGANLSTMGFSAEQQQILQQQFMMMSRGQNPDLAQVSGADNPTVAAQRIASSQLDLMQKSEGAMIDGFNKAATAVEKVNKVLGQFANELGVAKGFLQGFSGSDAGKGTMIAGGGVLSGAKDIFGGILKYKLAKQLISKLGPEAEALSVPKEASTLLSKGKPLLKTGGKIFRIAAIADALFELGKSVKNEIRDVSDSNFNPDPKQSFINATIHGTRYVDKQGNYVAGPRGGGTPGFGTGFNSSSNYTGTSAMSKLPSPIPGIQPTQNYGAKDSSTWKNKHTGLDYPAKMGTVVVSLTTGTVQQSTMGPDYGIHVVVDDGNGLQYIYAHLSRKTVQPGDKVTKGQRIGNVGDTGNADGPHLHLEVRKGKNNPIDPMTVLSKMSNATSDNQSTHAMNKRSVTPDNPSRSNKSGGTYANAQGVYNYLKSQGLSPNGAKGILGNLVSESGLRTGALGDNGTSYGIAQWHAGRWDNLKKFAKEHNLKPDSIEAQQQFLMHELQGYTGLLRSLKDPNISANAAAAMFMRQFERPKDQSNAAASRRAANIPDVKGGGQPGYGASFPDVKPKTTSTVTSQPTTTKNEVTNNFNIQVQVQSASEEEAKKFAKRVQDLIEEKSYITMAGSK